MSHTQGIDLAASDRNTSMDYAYPPILPTPTENTDIDEILTQKLFKQTNFKNGYSSGKAYRFKYPSDVTKAVTEAKAAIEQKLNEARIDENRKMWGKLPAGEPTVIAATADEDELNSYMKGKMSAYDHIEEELDGRLAELQASKRASDE